MITLIILLERLKSLYCDIVTHSHQALVPDLSLFFPQQFSTLGVKRLINRACTDGVAETGENPHGQQAFLLIR